MMKEKDNLDCDSFGAETQTVSNPLSMTRDNPAYVDWRDVGRFDPYAPRISDTNWTDYLSPAETWDISRAMATAQKDEAVRRERVRAKMLAKADEIVRGSTLANLYARQTLDDRRMRAAIEFREKYRISTGGVGAADWMREKVDGGRMFIGPEGGITSALDAERQIRDWLLKSGMGVSAAEVVLRVAGQDEELTPIACDFEDSPAKCAAAKAAMKPSRYAQDYVRRLLRDGLASLADHLYGRERRNRRFMFDSVRDWLTVNRAS